jgi:Carboxypeptidase regulatory-like domain
MRVRVVLRSVVFCCYLSLLLAFVLVPVASSQETTGGLKAYVKDKSSGTMAGAEVELSGSGLLVPRKAVADSSGYVYFQLLPPGEYTLTVSAKGFRTYKQTGILLETGKLPTYEVVLEVGSITEIVEVSAQPPIVDVTSSKVAVTIPEDVIQNIPKGRSYQSLIPFAPGARQEPLQSPRNNSGRNNGFQIDGASDSENTYLVEGLDTSELQGGGIKQNVVFEFVQEVQVKTSGFEAEYGGAVGGVVNVIQKRGSNDWHGSLVTYYHPDAFDSTDQCAVTPFSNTSEAPNALSGQQIACGLRANPSTSANFTTRTDASPEYYHQKQDRYYTIEPGYTLGGPIFKDRLWLFSSYVPTIQSISRTVNFTGKNPGPRTFTTKYTQQNALNRLDYQAYRKLHLFGSWQYGYSRVTGQLPLTPDSSTGQINSAAGTDPTTIRADTGNVYPSNIFNFGGEWTATSHLIVSARYGYFFYNTEDRGKPSGLRYIYQSDLVAQNCTAPCTPSTGLDGNFIAPTGSTFANTSGFSNISSNFQTIFDAFKRKAFSTDVSYSVSKWGQHNFKFGYGFNRLANDLLQGFNKAQTLITWAQSYTPGTTEGQANCAQIISQNQAQYGAGATQCQGNTGYFIVRDGVDAAGKVSSLNHGIYGQDSWTVGHGLTLNLGVRFDKEYLPPYGVGASSISFDFTDKVSPRIGGAYDLFRNGKVKIFASYGKFFDIMKYSLPRGSFGGEYWHDCVYAMDTVDYNLITPTAPNNHACPVSGPADGVTVGRFIENLDLRKNIIDLTDPGVDPNIKPMQQHEYVTGSDWAITPTLGLEVRYSRKRLDETIEDIGVTDNFGFYIGNPGPNAYADLLHRTLPGSGLGVVCASCPPQPKAIRRYDGLETRLTRRGKNFFGQIAYTYSSLTGNYAGLTNTDITDGNGGRHSPNNHRDFDHPDMQFTTSGKVMDGVLPTDRPHVLGGVGYYSLKWLGMETNFGVTQIIASGSPKSSCFSTIQSGSSCQFFDQRGTWVDITRAANGDWTPGAIHHDARTPSYTQTDLNFTHSFKVSKDHEGRRLSFEWNVLNALNQAAVLSYSPLPTAGSQSFLLPDTTNNGSGVNFQQLMTGWDPFAAANAKAYGVTTPLTLNNRYGLPFLFQTRRTMRMAVKFTF